MRARILPEGPRPIAARLGLAFKTSAQIDKVARHQGAFSIAGVRAIGRATGPR